jgi:hypothetical protein
VRQVELDPVTLKDLDRPERVSQLVIDGLPASFPPLRTGTDEPMDFGERLATKITADVERRIEMSLSGDGPDVDLKGTSRLALVGAIPLVLLGVAIVLLVVLVRAVL